MYSSRKQQAGGDSEAKKRKKKKKKKKRGARRQDKTRSASYCSRLFCVYGLIGAVDFFISFFLRWDRWLHCTVSTLRNPCRFWSGFFVLFSLLVVRIYHTVYNVWPVFFFQHFDAFACCFYNNH